MTLLQWTASDLKAVRMYMMERGSKSSSQRIRTLSSTISNLDMIYSKHSI